MNQGAQNLPKPFGEDVPREEWEQIFKRVIRNLTELNAFDGIRDYVAELLLVDRKIRRNGMLVIETPVPDFPDRIIQNESLLLIRAQYFDNGLHHRLSFHAKIKGRVKFEKYPALQVKIIEPVKRVSNVFVAVPTKDRPVLMEIPVAGAPPEIRLYEVSTKKLRAFLPHVNKIMPKTMDLKGIKMQLFDAGEAIVQGKIVASGTDRIEVNLAPIASESREIFENYLEKEFVEEHGQGRDKTASRGGSENQEEEPTARKAFKTEIKHRVLLTMPPSPIRDHLAAILPEYGWGCVVNDSWKELKPEEFAAVEMVCLSTESDGKHAVDVLREWIRDEKILPLRFIITGKEYSEVREPDWDGLGKGLFVRENAPESWLKKKLAEWLNIPVKEEVEIAGLQREQPLILIVDDDKQLLNNLDMLLTESMYRVITESSGEEAIRSATRLKPDLVLLDVNLPGTSGLDVLTSLRKFQATRDIPVIMLSGITDQEIIQKALAFKVADYIIKPFNDESLLVRIKAALQP